MHKSVVEIFFFLRVKAYFVKQQRQQQKIIKFPFFYYFFQNTVKHINYCIWIIIKVTCNKLKYHFGVLSVNQNCSEKK